MKVKTSLQLHSKTQTIDLSYLKSKQLAKNDNKSLKDPKNFKVKENKFSHIFFANLDSDQMLNQMLDQMSNWLSDWSLVKKNSSFY